MKKIYLSVLMAIPFLFNAQSIEGTWKLAQQAGALGVGPNQGDIGWWSSSVGDLATRDCLFDDSITFDASGNMTHYMDGNTFLETWQGASAETCGTPVSPHDGGTFTYTFSNNQLTINGTGGHMGLPKATNAGELSAQNPPAVPTSNTYEISFGANGELIADINFGGGWWRFVYTLTSQAPPPSHDVTFVVHTDSLVASGATVSAEGIRIAGGIVSSIPADGLQLDDSDGDGVWEGTMSLPAAGGHFTILNGNCGDWSCKENIQGQPCADAGNYNDRNNLLGGFSQDTTLILEYGSCETPVVGISDYSKNIISIYPNPTTDVINISSTSTITDYTIYNMIGNRVMSTNVNASNAVVDMSTLTKGVYFVEVNQNGILTNKRIIKK